MKSNNSKPIILFITQLYPFPPDMGGTLRTYGTITALLSLGYSVHLVSFTDAHANTNGGEVLNRKINKKIKTYTIKTKIIDDFHPLQKFWLYFKSVFLFKPYRVTKYSLNQATEIILTVLEKECPEIIYLDHLSSAVYLPLIKKMSPSVKIVLDIHDIDSQLSLQKFAHAKSILLKTVLLLEYLKSKFFEVKVLNGVDKVFVMSQLAKKYLETKISAPISIIPISLFETKTTKMYRLKRKNYKYHKWLTFIGTLSVDVNKDGLKWFIEKVWPLIKIKLPETRFVVVGSYGRDDFSRKLLSVDGVLYLGYQRNLEPVYRQTAIGIIPLLVGGTVRMKALGFLTRGIPVVSTKAGIYGIPKIKSGIHCLVGDSALEFAIKTVWLLKNNRQREKMGQNAISLVRNYYTFDRLRNFLGYELNQLMS